MNYPITNINSNLTIWTVPLPLTPAGLNVSVNVTCCVGLGETPTAFMVNQEEILTEPSHVFSQPVDQKPNIYLDLRQRQL